MDSIAERIDSLVTLDIGHRGVIGELYRAARERMDSPLYEAAAKALVDRLGRDDIVLICSGWHDRQAVNSEIAETDGPVGAVALARGLNEAFGVTPVILTDQNLQDDMARLLMAAGLRPMRSEEARAGLATENAPLRGGVIMDFPRMEAQAEQKAEEIIASFDPAAIISIETGGLNAQGRIITFRGDDATAAVPKFDYLFRKAEKAVSMGIGDGGNELGFGSIAEAAAKVIRKGTDEDASELVPVTEVDHILPAAVSNWGAYGLLAAIAVCTEQTRCMHPPEREEALLIRARDLGFIDGISGFVEATTDGIPLQTHRSVTEILCTMVHLSRGRDTLQ